MFLRGLFIAFAFTSLSGCVSFPSKYQSTNFDVFSGSLNAQLLTPTQIRVIASVNDYSPPGTAYDWCLLRSAELAIDNGFTGFTVVSAGGPSSRRMAYGLTYGGVTGVNIPADQTSNLSSTNVTIIAEFSNDAELPDFFDAQETIDIIGARVER